MYEPHCCRVPCRAGHGDLCGLGRCRLGVPGKHVWTSHLYARDLRPGYLRPDDLRPGHLLSGHLRAPRGVPARVQADDLYGCRHLRSGDMLCSGHVRSGRVLRSGNVCSGHVPAEDVPPAWRAMPYLSARDMLCCQHMCSGHL